MRHQIPVLIMSVRLSMLLHLCQYLGERKIYLIDEAHMLSKAAFNAFLKILEEPPPSVVFMLATTDPHKIIDTVTSRCFQLFFDPIVQDEVVKHLAFICTEESVTYEVDALVLIAQETGGSMRDALILLNVCVLPIQLLPRRQL